MLGTPRREGILSCGRATRLFCVVLAGAGSAGCNEIAGISTPRRATADAGAPGPKTPEDPCARVTCTAIDRCHEPGLCDPATGLCSNPPITCRARDACHEAGECDPRTGMCTNPELADGTPCDDNVDCTPTSQCQAGVCTSASPLTHEWARWAPGDGPRYQVVDDTVVTDMVTGLTWARVVSSPMTWQQAVDHCGNLVLSELDGWRLPTRIELLSIVDYTRVGPSIDLDAFPGATSYLHWTSTHFSAEGAYYINFTNGESGQQSRSMQLKAFCVH